jgi:exodeoxyribonuclease-3
MKKNLRIFSYNVNGIRAAITKGFDEWLLQEKPDIISLQEIKAEPSQVDTNWLTDAGYKQFWFPAQKKGYSGVAVFTRIEPDLVQYGINQLEFDAEGRVLRTDYGDITLLSCYFPSGTSGDIRQEIKMRFLEEMLTYVEELKKTRPNIIIAGDYNICHKPIDINHPKKHETMSGFLPEEREWMDRWQALGLVDSFRQFNTAADQYSWWSYRAGSRGKNLGWRIDYHWVTASLASRLRDAGILQQVIHSDHCPIWLELE